MMTLAFAPRELITAWRAESVNRVIHVSETSRAAGRVNRKTRSIISSFFGLAIFSRNRPVMVHAFHSAFAENWAWFQHVQRRDLIINHGSSAMFMEIGCTEFCKNR
jgi:hypothetical protein